MKGKANTDICEAIPLFVVFSKVVKLWLAKLMKEVKDILPCKENPSGIDTKTDVQGNIAKKA